MNILPFPSYILTDIIFLYFFLNAVSTFMGYLVPKPSLYNYNGGAI